MEQYIDPEFLEARLAEITVWVQDHIFVLGAVIQFVVIALAFLIDSFPTEDLTHSLFLAFAAGDCRYAFAYALPAG